VYISLVKPLLDKALSLALLLLLMPILLLLSILIYIKMGRPIFFKQKRPGKNEKIFTIFKFRTMSNETDDKGKLLSDDLRLHGLGAFIRSSSLDELPQLFNILKGEMSFIGPRPLLIEYLDLYNEEQKKRHLITPGMSGWAQINGRNAISWKSKFEYDVFYVKNASFLLDVKIVYLTLIKIFKRDGVNAKNEVTTTAFKGNDYE